MKIINLNGYSHDELFTWRATVYRNVVESSQTIAQFIMDAGQTFEKSELNVHVLFQQLVLFILTVTLYRLTSIDYYLIKFQATQKVN